MIPKNMFEAAIFDMDGLLIDSEPFWRDAEKEVFGSLGIEVTESLAYHTSRMTTKEVTSYWYNYKSWTNKSLEETEQAVIKKVGQFIDQFGVIMPGIQRTLRYFKNNGYKIGLATNSPIVLVWKILRKLNIEHYFDAISSSDSEHSGKPFPDVYLKTALKLNVDPAYCIAFEDSTYGIQAALAAGMKVIAVPAKGRFHDPGFKIASIKISCLNDFCEEHIKLLAKDTC